MARNRVKFDRNAFSEILNSDGVRDDIQRRVDNVRDLANRMFAANGYQGNVITTDRPHGAVWAGDIHSRRSNAKHNTLMKALDSFKE